MESVGHGTIGKRIEALSSNPTVAITSRGAAQEFAAWSGSR